jgi:uncharacterized membrane protein (UPF0127 family)
MVVLIAACGSAQGEDAGEATESRPQPTATTSEQQVPSPPRGTAWVIFGADTVLAEVARSPNDRAQGLMYREELPAGTGMLFVFEESDIRSFWMSNTYVALDIAYMDPAFVIVDIQQMEPLTTAPHESTRPAMFALEVPKGWFAEHGITVGATPRIVFGLQ